MRTARQYGELGRILAGVAPFMTGILFVFIGAVPAGLPEFSPVSPLFALCAVFFWALTRPSLMPPAAVFTIGLLQDSLSGGPIGLWALTFLLTQAFTVSQRRILLGNNSNFGLMSFALVALGAGIFSWMAACIFYGVLLPPAPVLVQSVLTALAYPVMAWMLIRIWRFIPSSI